MTGPQNGDSLEVEQEVDCDEEPDRNEKSVAVGPVKVRVLEAGGVPGGSK